MSVQQETKAPFFLSLSCFALGVKAKTNGKPSGWSVCLLAISLSANLTVCQSCQPTDLKPGQASIFFFSKQGNKGTKVPYKKKLVNTNWKILTV